MSEQNSINNNISDIAKLDNRQRGQLAEHRARFRDFGDLSPLLEDLRDTLSEHQQSFRRRAGGQHDLTRLIRRDGQGLLDSSETPQHRE